jgi:hypothetical protein
MPRSAENKVEKSPRDAELPKSLKTFTKEVTELLGVENKRVADLMASALFPHKEDAVDFIRSQREFRSSSTVLKYHGVVVEAAQPSPDSRGQFRHLELLDVEGSQGQLLDMIDIIDTVRGVEGTQVELDLFSADIRKIFSAKRNLELGRESCSTELFRLLQVSAEELGLLRIYLQAFIRYSKARDFLNQSTIANQFLLDQVSNREDSRDKLPDTSILAVTQSWLIDAINRNIESRAEYTMALAAIKKYAEKWQENQKMAKVK